MIKIITIYNDNTNEINIKYESTDHLYKKCNLIINIPIYELYFRNYQIYQVKNKGISKINNENIFDTNIKSNINIHIFLE